MRNADEFNACAQVYMNMVFRLAFSYLKSKQDADDVVQNVLLSLYKTDREFESEDHLRNWLIRVTINECKKIWRMPWNRHENIDDYADRLLFEDSGSADLFAAIMRIDRAKRMVLILYYIEGYSIREMARLLHIPVGTAGTRLARARAELKDYLKEE